METQSKIIAKTVETLAEWADDATQWVDFDAFTRYGDVLRDMRVVSGADDHTVHVFVPDTRDGHIWGHAAADALDRAADAAGETDGHIRSSNDETVWTYVW